MKFFDEKSMVSLTTEAVVPQSCETDNNSIMNFENSKSLYTESLESIQNPGVPQNMTDNKFICHPVTIDKPHIKEKNNLIYTEWNGYKFWMK